VQGVSIVVPVYNEMRTLSAMLDRVRMAPTAGLKKEVIVVDDGSTDGSTEFLRQLHDDGVVCVFHDRNQGKGAAVRRASLAQPGMSSSCRTPTSSTTRTITRSCCAPSSTARPMSS